MFLLKEEDLKTCGNLKKCGVCVSVIACPEQISKIKEHISLNEAMDFKKILKKINPPVIFSIFAVFANQGCGYYCDVDTCTYEIASQEDWLPGAVRGAIEFWADKGVFLELAEENADVKIEVGDLSDEEHGRYDALGAKIIINDKIFNLNYYDIEPETLDLRRKCTITHEIGHSFGMNHTENNGGLMSEVISYSDTDCIFNEKDQEELERIIKQDDEQDGQD